jgi:hypothetical protein
MLIIPPGQGVPILEGVPLKQNTLTETIISLSLPLITLNSGAFPVFSKIY